MFTTASTAHRSGVVYFPLAASLPPKNTEATEVVTECLGSNSWSVLAQIMFEKDIIQCMEKLMEKLIKLSHKFFFGMRMGIWQNLAMFGPSHVNLGMTLVDLVGPVS
jgi:hypothetical protein